MSTSKAKSILALQGDGYTQRRPPLPAPAGTKRLLPPPVSAPKRQRTATTTTATTTTATTINTAAARSEKQKKYGDFFRRQLVFLDVPDVVAAEWFRTHLTPLGTRFSTHFSTQCSLVITSLDEDVVARITTTSTAATAATATAGATGATAGAINTTTINSNSNSNSNSVNRQSPAPQTPFIQPSPSASWGENVTANHAALSLTAQQRIQLIALAKERTMHIYTVRRIEDALVKYFDANRLSCTATTTTATTSAATTAATTHRHYTTYLFEERVNGRGTYLEFQFPFVMIEHASHKHRPFYKEFAPTEEDGYMMIRFPMLNWDSPTNGCPFYMSKRKEMACMQVKMAGFDPNNRSLSRSSVLADSKTHRQTAAVTATTKTTTTTKGSLLKAVETTVKNASTRCSTTTTPQEAIKSYMAQRIWDWPRRQPRTTRADRIQQLQEKSTTALDLLNDSHFQRCSSYAAYTGMFNLASIAGTHRLQSLYDTIENRIVEAADPHDAPGPDDLDCVRKLATRHLVERKPKSGYCECCRVKYVDYERHVVGSAHRAFSCTDCYYDQLDWVLEMDKQPRRGSVKGRHQSGGAATDDDVEYDGGVETEVSETDVSLIDGEIVRTFDSDIGLQQDEESSEKSEVMTATTDHDPHVQDDEQDEDRDGDDDDEDDGITSGPSILPTETFHARRVELLVEGGSSDLSSVRDSMVSSQGDGGGGVGGREVEEMQSFKTANTNQTHDGDDDGDVPEQDGDAFEFCEDEMKVGRGCIRKKPMAKRDSTREKRVSVSPKQQENVDVVTKPVSTRRKSKGRNKSFVMDVKQDVPTIDVLPVVVAHHTGMSTVQSRRARGKGGPSMKAAAEKENELTPVMPTVNKSVHHRSIVSPATKNSATPTKITTMTHLGRLQSPQVNKLANADLDALLHTQHTEIMPGRPRTSTTSKRRLPYREGYGVVEFETVAERRKSSRRSMVASVLEKISVSSGRKSVGQGGRVPRTKQNNQKGESSVRVVDENSERDGNTVSSIKESGDVDGKTSGPMTRRAKNAASMGVMAETEPKKKTVGVVAGMTVSRRRSRKSLPEASEL